jgi:NADPH:quinone reductase-like Zn-dependent oxidoreductase
MNAIRLHETDGLDALVYETVPRPKPDNDELLVRVYAAGVNPLDWLVCSGAIPEVRDEPLPWILGWDLSGVVVSVGNDVTAFEPGEAVYGMSRLPGAGGSFAEYITLSAEEVRAKPTSLSHIEAAGLPMAGQTAFHSLYRVAGISPGHRILIHAAAGGVGHMAVQFASNTDAHVIGTASGRNEAFLHDLGIDEFVNYREERFEEVLDDVDIALDAIGGEVLKRTVEVVKPNGVVVTLPEQPPADAVERYKTQHDVTVRFFDVLTESDPATPESVTAHVKADVLEHTISEVYSLAEAQQALKKSLDGHVRGKLILRVADY